MKMLFKQRMFSWFDSYDIYDEYGNTLFVVKGQLSWGHCLRIFDAAGCPVGCVKEKIFTWLPKFELYTGEDDYVGCLSRELTLFRPSYHIDCNGWRIEGSFWEWDYDILAPAGIPWRISPRSFGIGLIHTPLRLPTQEMPSAR